MRLTSGVRTLLTGASGGLGLHLSVALARKQARLGLVAYPGHDLHEVAGAAERARGTASVLGADLREIPNVHRAVEQFEREFGGIDLLVNGAAVEYTRAFHELSIEELLD